MRDLLDKKEPTTTIAMVEITNQELMLSLSRRREFMETSSLLSKMTSPRMLSPKSTKCKPSS
jgi:hypothetical protein